MQLLRQKVIPWFKKFWWLVALVVLALGATFFFYRRQQSRQAQALADLKTVVFAKKDLTSTLDLSGIVDAKRKVKLFYSTGGKLTKVNAQKGDTVTAGQVLAVIDQADLQKRLEKSLNNYLVDRLQFDDYQDQFKTRAPTEEENLASQLDQIGLNNSVLDVEISSIAINNTKLTSPIDGLITDAPDLVAPMNILYTDAFTVVDPKTLVFRAMVDELDLSLIHEGQEALIEFDAVPDLEITTTISNISLTSVVGNSGTAFEVEFQLPDANLDLLRLGMNGDAHVILARKTQVSSVPLDALYTQNGQHYVRVLLPAAKTTVEKVVTTGLETEDDVEILTGLDAGDLVVVN